MYAGKVQYLVLAALSFKDSVTAVFIDHRVYWSQGLYITHKTMYVYCQCIVSFPGSTMSLVAGASIGGLLAYGAWQMSQNPRNFLLSFGEYTSSL